MSRCWDVGSMRGLSWQESMICGGDARGGWRAPGWEGVYLCLVYKFPSTSGSLNTSFIFWSANSHWGLSGLTLSLGWMGELEAISLDSLLVP